MHFAAQVVGAVSKRSGVALRGLCGYSGMRMPESASPRHSPPNVTQEQIRLNTYGFVDHTEVLSIRSVQGQPRLQAVIIPGNPGVAVYYVPFMQAMYKAFDGQIDVFSISQIGHGSSTASTLQGYNLDQQIQHKMAYLREQILLPDRPPAVLLGHSIGAYMALHAVHRLEGEESEAARPPLPNAPQVLKIVAIFPFFTVNPGCTKQRFLKLVASYAKSLDPHALEATLRLFRRSIVRNAFFLAQHEFKDLAAPADWWLLRYFGRRAEVLCAPNDMWFPLWQWKEMLTEVPKVQARQLKGQRHDFCVCEALSEKLASICCNLLRSSMAKEQDGQS